MLWYRVVMRLSFTFFITIVFIISFGTAASAQVSTARTFTENLSLGSSGAQVVALQKILNQDLATHIPTTGYFGALTRAAVIQFQNKYATAILTPAGLTQGNGYVGSYTCTKLTAISGVTTSIISPTLPTITQAPTPLIAPTTPQNPNLKNIDLYIAAIRKNGMKQGLSSTTLSLIEQKIRNEAATTTDFRKQFFQNQQAIYAKKVSENSSSSPLVTFVEKVFSILGSPFTPEKAYAGTGLPFGGYITYVDPVICDCSAFAVTQIFVAGADPLTSDLLLDYIDGSEAFSSYNIPEPGIAVLGIYEPFIDSCYTYIPPAECIPVSEGTITPEVGSSLVPMPE
jgi:peptidoglycan hydrolase-like protein with peptidoglycan-binding domain